MLTMKKFFCVDLIEDDQTFDSVLTTSRMGLSQGREAREGSLTYVKVDRDALSKAQRATQMDRDEFMFDQQDEVCSAELNDDDEEDPFALRS